MKYFSLNNKQNTASFKEAVVNGIAPDKGLYFPSEIPKLDEVFLASFQNLSQTDLAFELIKPFVGSEIPANKLKQIIEETLSFDFPLVKLSENNFILELFHGPTLAFKDVGARFMARCLGYFNEKSEQNVTVLVATSGDTGGAVAHGFYGVEGVEVVILYPKGRVSAIQEKQLTTFGKNIRALEVDGSFDDCQAMVKKAFLDKEITSKIKLTSANSINVARWLPQMFYYAFALQKLLKQGEKQVVFSVPSGNFGNICAAFMLKKIGLPIHHLVAACNANDVVPQYLKTGVMEEKKSVATISNAMDVALPSNFVRIMQLYNNDVNALKKDLSSYSFSDSETQEMMREIYTEYSYILDPHGAVAMLGSKAFIEQHKEALVVSLETAHPCKFIDVVEETLALTVDIPSLVKEIMHKEKSSTEIENYEQLKANLL